MPKATRKATTPIGTADTGATRTRRRATIARPATSGAAQIAESLASRTVTETCHLTRRFSWTRSDAEDALAQIIANADVVGTTEDAGRGADGPTWRRADDPAFILVTVHPELLAYLASFGADAEELEDDDPGGADDDRGDASDDVDGEPEPEEEGFPEDRLSSSAGAAGGPELDRACHALAALRRRRRRHEAVPGEIALSPADRAFFARHRGANVPAASDS